MNTKIKNFFKKIEESGILDDTFNIKKNKIKKTGHSEVTAVRTSDRYVRNNQNADIKNPLVNYPSSLPGFVAEDSLLPNDYDSDFDIIDTKHFDNDDIVNCIETLITLVNNDKKKIKLIFNLLNELIKSLPVEELPLDIRHKLANKLINKNSKLIN
jgi:hypothetical protein